MVKKATKKAKKPSKSTKSPKASFFTFNQNNSGGSFDYEKGKLSHWVIIEAPDAQAANDKAESLGIYFNGCADGSDCSCCGDRWSEAYAAEGKPKPEIYGQDVSKGVYNASFLWMSKNPEAYIHYLNGKIKPVMGNQVPYKSMFPKKGK